MHARIPAFAALLVAVVTGTSPRTAAAQGYGTVECDSKHDQRSYCAVPGIDPSSVTMDEKLSQAPCIRDESWGADKNGVWVDDGCRARFGYVKRSSGQRGASSSGAGTIECDSRGGARAHCAVPGIDQSSVTMDEKLSESPCILGESWGTDPQGIWVSRGCRARFGYITTGGGAPSAGGASSQAGRESSCLARAERDWNVPSSNIEVLGTKKLDDGVRELTLQSRHSTGKCYVDSRGRITKFVTR